MRRPYERGQFLILGIIGAWLALVGRQVWSYFFRANGSPDWMLTHPFLAFIVWMSVIGGFLHLLARGALQGNIPRTNWYFAFGVQAAGLTLFAIVSSSLRYPSSLHCKADARPDHGQYADDGSSVDRITRRRLRLTACEVPEIPKGVRTFALIRRSTDRVHLVGLHRLSPERRPLTIEWETGDRKRCAGERPVAGWGNLYHAHSPLRFAEASISSRMRSVNRGQLSPTIAVIDFAATFLRRRSKQMQAGAIARLQDEVIQNPGLAANLLETYNPADYAAKRRMILQRYGVRATQTLNLLDEAHDEESDSMKAAIGAN